tara:strand:+ start:61 stop:234 length:174 start_codon:yes stop_codon:yes gene_type:complete
MSKELKTYTLYAIREVSEVAVVDATSETEAIEKAEGEWECESDLSFEITSVEESEND